MKKLFAALVAGLFALSAVAQSYPAPTFGSLILQNPLTPANGGTGATTSTGTGSVVLSNSPAFTTPNLGTPSAATLTNATGLPLTGLVAQAANTVIANATGSTAAPAAFAMPSCSGTNNALRWTSGTGFSCASSIALTTGNLSQFAATTSAQLAGMVSDETGSGSLVFGTSPTISSPAISGGSVNNAPIGATTPSTGSFTTLAASGTVSGAGFSNYLASPPAIGGTAANTGAFTTLSASTSATAPTLAVGTNSTGVATTAFDVKGKFCPSILDYGGSTGATDNTAALTATIAASAAINANNICVYEPPGNYKFASQYVYTLPSTSASFTLLGAGADVTINSWAAGGGLKINYLGAFNSAHIRGMSLTTGTTATGSALTLNQTAASIPNPALSALSDVSDVTIRGSDGYVQTDYWATGVTVAGVSNINFPNLTIWGPSNSGFTTVGNGVSLIGTSGTYGVVYNFSNDFFGWIGNGINYGSYIQGVTVSQSNFTGGSYGIVTQPSAPGLDQLSVVDSQFNVAQVGIYTQTYIPNTQVSSSLFLIANGGVGINLLQSCNYNIIGDSFNQYSGTSIEGVVIGGSSCGGQVVGNTFSNLTTGVSLLSTAANVNVQANSYSSNTNNVLDAGTNDTVETGTGNAVRAVSPVLTTPNLGTPSAATLTNATGLPISTGVSGLGSGVASALGSAATGSGGPVLATSPTITTPVIVGVTSGTAAAAGNVGQPLTNSASGVSLTSGTPANITSLSLTAGDWDVCGNVYFLPAGSTIIQAVEAGMSATSAALPGATTGLLSQLNITLTAGSPASLAPVCQIVNISSSATEYLVGEAVFSTSTLTASGYISARRRH